MPNAHASSSNARHILLLEDSDTDAELISTMLQQSGVPTTITRVNSIDGFTAALRDSAPDVVLSDNELAQLDARTALDILRDQRPTVPFIIVTTTLNGTKIVSAIRAGAENLVLKSYLDELPESIEAALEIRRPLQRLTRRQVEVLQLVAGGLRTREIAARLNLSIKTVESHRGEIMKRLGVHDVVGLVRYAIRVGLIDSGT